MMRRETMAVLLIGLGMSAGCIAWKADSERMRAENIDRMNLFYEEAQANAVLVQQAIFPYHFHQGSDQLNPIGERDLAILADHYMENSGVLRVRRGDAPEALHEARVGAVRDYLSVRGVPGAHVVVDDAYPGGPGMPSHDVHRILVERQELTEEQRGGTGILGGR